MLLQLSDKHHSSEDLFSFKVYITPGTFWYILETMISVIVVRVDEYLKILYLILTQQSFKRKRRKCKAGISRALSLGCYFDSWLIAPGKNCERPAPQKIWVSRFPWGYSNVFLPPKAIPFESLPHLPEQGILCCKTYLPNNIFWKANWLLTSLVHSYTTSQTATSYHWHLTLWYPIKKCPMWPIES